MAYRLVNCISFMRRSFDQFDGQEAAPLHPVIASSVFVSHSLKLNEDCAGVTSVSRQTSKPVGAPLFAAHTVVHEE